MDFASWVRDVKQRTLADALGDEEAERALVRSPMLAPQLPEELRGKGLLEWRPSVDGAGRATKTDEAKAREYGVSVKVWRALSR